MSSSHTLLNGLVSVTDSNTGLLLNDHSAKAKEALKGLVVPTSKDEDWKYTSLRDLTKHTFTPSVSTEFVDEDVEYVDAQFAAVITFVNGKLDSIMNPDNLKITSSCSSDEENCFDSELVDDEVYGADVFAMLNKATISDIVKIEVNKSEIIDRPVYIRHINADSENKPLQTPRLIVKAGASSSLKIIEDFVSVSDDNVYLSVPYSNYVLEQNAHVIHVKIQRESKSAFHISRIVSELKKDSHYESYTVNLGSKLCRNDVAALQREDSINCTLDGLVIVSNDQVSDTHTIMDHKMPHGESHQLHKVIADDHAQSVFNGKIFVRQDAQKTNSFQENRSLMLSPTCVIDSKPQLEIFADDVKCSHGATIGQLEDEHLFYLKSRGLSDSEAVQLLTYAFAAEVVHKIPIDEVKSLIIKSIERFTKFNKSSKTPVEV